MGNQIKFEKGRKHLCPQCNKQTFVRFIDEEGQYWGSDFGKCDRAINCGYENRPIRKKTGDEATPVIAMNWGDAQLAKPVIALKQNSPVYSTLPAFLGKERVVTQFLPERWVEQSYNERKLWDHNNFVEWLFNVAYFDEVPRVVERYKIGTMDSWRKGSTVFWQIAPDGKVHAGKCMLYNLETGKRVKEDGKAVMNWVHKIKKVANWEYSMMFFGGHLLPEAKSVIIVESEKNAILASILFPNEVAVIATGGLEFCKPSLHPEIWEVMRGKNVVLVPDVGATQKWMAWLPVLKSLGIKARVYDGLDKIVNPFQRKAGWDIADQLTTTTT